MMHLKVFDDADTCIISSCIKKGQNPANGPLPVFNSLAAFTTDPAKINALSGGKI